MSSTSPTVVFIHGSWHTPKHFERVCELFQAHRFPTSCKLQPSVGKLPPIGLMEDAECIRTDLKELIDTQSKDVIVIAHSYGGVVATQAIDKEFGKKDREAKGKTGGIIRIVYVCAFIVPLGESLGTTLGGAPPPDTKLPPFIQVEEDGRCMILDPQRRFYHDLPPDEQAHWTSELIKCPAVAQLTPLTHTAYLYHPVTYLFCEDDQGLPLFLQQEMVKKVEESTGITIKKQTCNAGHSPFLSQPETLLQLVKKIVSA